ncbi:class I SAM-dependent methyltransferase [bacterium]|nr:class I SAM-dependent methyltransferase [bacterium]
MRPLPAVETNDYFEGPEAVARMDEADCARRDFLRARLERLGAANGLLFEIGCGTGRVLEMARETGWQVAGIELSAALADQARALNPGASIPVGDVLEVEDLPWGECAAVVGLDVIEHVLDPVAMLQRVARLLQPGGAVLLHTPNARSIRARLHREHWNMRIPEYHFHLATPAGIEAALEKAGLRLEALSTTSGTGKTDGFRRLAEAGKGALLRPLRLGNALEVLARK